MPDLTSDQLTLALTVVAGLAVIIFFFTLILALRLGKLRRDYAVLRGEGEERDILAAVSRAMKRVEALDKRVDSAMSAHEEQAAIGRTAIQNLGVVRYDAFEEQGGRLSFSAAFVDDHGNGLVLTSINGRTEARTYAKPLIGLQSEYNLSDEEREAIAIALASKGRDEVAQASN